MNEAGGEAQQAIKIQTAQPVDSSLAARNATLDVLTANGPRINLSPGPDFQRRASEHIRDATNQLAKSRLGPANTELIEFLVATAVAAGPKPEVLSALTWNDARVEPQNPSFVRTLPNYVEGLSRRLSSGILGGDAAFLRIYVATLAAAGCYAPEIVQDIVERRMRVPLQTVKDRATEHITDIGNKLALGPLGENDTKALKVLTAVAIGGTQPAPSTPTIVR